MMEHFILFPHESSHSTLMALRTVGKKVVTFSVMFEDCNKVNYFCLAAILFELDLGTAELWADIWACRLMNTTLRVICHILQEILKHSIPPSWKSEKEQSNSKPDRRRRREPIYPEVLLFFRLSMTWLVIHMVKSCFWTAISCWQQFMRRGVWKMTLSLLGQVSGGETFLSRLLWKTSLLSLQCTFK